MKKQIKKALIFLVVLCVVIPFLSCGDDGNATTTEKAVEKTAVAEKSAGVVPTEFAENITVALCGHGLESESCQRDFHQMKIECAHRGWEYIDCMTVRDSNEQRETLETLIRKKVDAIVITYWDMEAVADLVLKAEEAGIGVYCVDTELRPGVIASCTQNNALAGALMSYWGILRLNERGKVSIFSGKWHIMRRRAYVAATLFDRDYPALELVSEEFLPLVGYEQAALDTAENWMTKYGDDLDWIFSGWDTPGMYAAKIVEQAGYTRDDIFITGIDGGSTAYAMIREGSPFAACVSQPFELYVHTIFDIINQVELGVEPGDEGSLVPSTRVIFKTPIVTDETNVPDPGQSIHAVFDYYGGDPDDPDAWYNWPEEDGPYHVM